MVRLRLMEAESEKVLQNGIIRSLFDDVKVMAFDLNII